MKFINQHLYFIIFQRFEHDHVFAGFAILILDDFTLVFIAFILHATKGNICIILLKVFTTFWYQCQWKTLCLNVNFSNIALRNPSITFK